MPYTDKDRQRKYWAERHKQKWANDPAYRERKAADHKRYYERNKERLLARRRALYAANLKYERVRMRVWRKRNLKKIAAQRRIKGQAIRDEVIQAYGGWRCLCCGETEHAFLSLDHIGGNGYKHQKEVRRFGGAYYVWLKQNGFPEGFRVLCHNCNQGRRMNGGSCPHGNGI
jgi:hypothetical protein